MAKLDKIAFANLCVMVQGWMENGGDLLAPRMVEELDRVIDIPEAPMINAETLHVLMALMQEGTRKIEAIKQHRMMTGYGLKESKDVIEKYCHNADAQLLARIRQALGTTVDGDDLVQVARNAYRNSEELASQHNDLPKDATLGDILHSARRTKAGNNIG